MSRTLDRLEAAIHGSPSGYEAGCRSRGGCPNRRGGDLLTCCEARIAASHYLAFARQDPAVPISRAALKAVRRQVYRPWTVTEPAPVGAAHNEEKDF